MMLLWDLDSAKRWFSLEKELPLNFDNDTAIRMLLFHAMYLANIYRYQSYGWESFEILTTNDSCPSCMSNAGKVFTLQDLPELPNPKCTHHYGCRCVLIPKSGLIK